MYQSGICLLPFWYNHCLPSFCPPTQHHAKGVDIQVPAPPMSRPPRRCSSLSSSISSTRQHACLRDSSRNVNHPCFFVCHSLLPYPSVVPSLLSFLFQLPAAGARSCSRLALYLDSCCSILLFSQNVGSKCTHI